MATQPLPSNYSQPIASSAVVAKRGKSGLEDMEAEALDKFLRRIYKRNEALRAAFYPSWFEALGFLQDLHYSQYQEQIGLYDTPRAFGKQTYRAVINLTLGAHQNLVAKTIKTRPRSTVIPLNGDTLSADVVRFMNQLDDYFELKLRRERIRIEALGWAYSCGYGVTKSFYDENSGDTLSTQQITTTDDDDLKGLEHEEFTSLPLPIFERIQQGDLRYECRSPFQVGYDMRNATARDSNFWYDSQHFRIEEFREMFKDSWRNVKAKSRKDSGDAEKYLADLRRNLGASTNEVDPYFSTFGDRDANEDIKVVEWYFKPDDRWPEGAMIHWTPDAKDGAHGVLNVQTCPWFLEDNGKRHYYMWHPFTIYEDIILPGKPVARATIVSAIQVNKMLNRNVSAIQEFVNLCAKYRIIISKGTAVDREQFTDNMFDFVEVNGEPKEVMHAMPAPQLPPDVKEQRNYLQNTFDIIVGQTLEEEGKAVKSNLSGDAIENLDALQQVRTIPKVITYVDGLTEDARKHVLLAKQFYGQDILEDRNIIIAGRSGRHRVRMFDESLVAMDARFSIVGMSDLTRSQAAKRAEAMKLYNAGLFGPVGDPSTSEKMLEVYEYGHIDAIYEDSALDKALTQERLDAILDRQEPNDDGPWHFEDHVKAQEEINRFRKKHYGVLDLMQRNQVDYLAYKHAEFQAQKDLMMGQEQQEMNPQQPPGGPNPSPKDTNPKRPDEMTTKETASNVCLA